MACAALAALVRARAPDLTWGASPTGGATDLVDVGCVSDMGPPAQSVIRISHQCSCSGSRHWGAMSATSPSASVVRFGIRRSCMQKIFLFTLLLILAAWPAVHAEPMVKVEHFDADPGWEGFNNRIVPTKLSVVKQDFGYSQTDHAAKSKGE